MWRDLALSNILNVYGFSTICLILNMNLGIFLQEIKTTKIKF